MRHVSTKLLHVFVLVMEYRDLSAVAACTQGRVPTVAYSLARLREITGDPLFVKRNGMLEPTPHALRLEQTARQILAKWNQLVRPGEPGLSKRRDDGRRVSIGFSSSIGDPVITEILTALCEQFPRDSFITRPVIADATLAGHLGSGELDCAFIVDSGHDPERVRQHNIMATPRRLVSATRGGSHDEGESDWILLQEDCEAGSPLRAFLSRQASTPGHRETVVPSWHTQITLLHSAGGICPVLDFNVPLVTRERKTRLLAPPSSFPEWAALHFWAPERSGDKGVLRDIMDVGSAVLRAPLKAIDSRRNGRAAAHAQSALA
ncbi:DNA-binding transcriptional regulator, LysR family [Cupriavidus necator]|uniref:LysR family transcriptional regulator n=1 Tax=Cupriavidus necator (strain ATCC 17699 / DSM 428 / KCTC 22496 / NCIMB 10442 / H16 / Stanier 337) TaxID=381666 RepID=Q0JZG2_CUPNH|nr:MULTISPECIES: LysR family transcriptional regulator [Cupriavidus]EON19908.1 LysR family transcriptional regulator [Cupriavidus sp. GA3-3]KUE90637.1 LysR family transcriptional regulator [Cupriavidus necator]QCC04663.1 LysR family transcriptional regulator [Cupriavidus necator H16]QQB79355.1 LysR family transcriptional regulator [Cupriavidus necator]WKA43583.1 LysR family transcriptional regulator [Cupriavidus necator]